MWRQPRTVWSVAFACVISFMGIGLVDPILKPIADELGAGPSQVSLLFTSYLAVMGIAMLGTGWVSSRVVPSAPSCSDSSSSSPAPASPEPRTPSAGSSRSEPCGVSATPCSSQPRSPPSSTPPRDRSARRSSCTRPRSASASRPAPCWAGGSGTSRGAGPSSASQRSWRSRSWPPLCSLPATPPPARGSSLSAPLRALGHRGLLTVGLTALLYNFASSPCWRSRPSRSTSAPRRSGSSSSAGGCFLPSPRCSSRRGSSVASGRSRALSGPCSGSRPSSPPWGSAPITSLFSSSGSCSPGRSSASTTPSSPRPS